MLASPPDGKYVSNPVQKYQLGVKIIQEFYTSIALYSFVDINPGATRAHSRTVLNNSMTDYSLKFRRIAPS